MRGLQETGRLRSTGQGRLKIAFLKNKLTVYEGLVVITGGQLWHTSAKRGLCYIEQAKSRGLADLIAFALRPIFLPGTKRRFRRPWRVS